MASFLNPVGAIWIILFSIHLLALAIATVYDIKYRIIPDKTWGLLLLSSAILLSYEFLANTYDVVFFILYAVNAFFGLFIGLTMFYTGAWGGADSKAIMTIGITYPYIPFLSSCSVPPILILSVNFLFVIILVVFGFVGYNLIDQVLSKENLFQNVEGTFGQKIIALVSGFKETPERLLNSKFLEPLEKQEDGFWVLSAQLFQEIFDDDELARMKKKVAQQAIESNRNKIWVRPQPPGILFLLVAFMLSAFLGNPLLEFLLC